MSSILFPLALLVTVNLSVMVVVTGQRTLAAVAQRLPFLSPAADLWSWTRYVLLFCIFFLFFDGVLNLAAPFGTPRLPMLVSSLVPPWRWWCLRRCSPGSLACPPGCRWCMGRWCL